MSARVWLGNAARVAQITTLTVGGTVEVGDEFICTIGNKSLTVVATTTSLATTAQEIAAAWNASVEPEFAEATAVAVTAVITLTGPSGVPFSVAASTTESGGGAADAQTFMAATPTAATGPNFYSNVDNWSGGAVPITGDDAYFLYGDVDLLYDIEQSAVTLDSITVGMGYRGEIGLPNRNESGYDEYRQRTFDIGATTISHGTESGGGSGRCRINTGAAQTTLTVFSTGVSVEGGRSALEWKGTHAANVVRVRRGSIGVALDQGEVATIATLETWIGSVVRCGSGVTLTTVLHHDGTLYLNSGATSLESRAGDCTIDGGGAFATLTASGGHVYYNSTGTITTAHVSTRGTLDFSRDSRAKTVNNCNVYSNAALLDPRRAVVFTNGVNLQHSRLSEVTLDLGTHVNITAALL